MKNPTVATLLNIVPGLGYLYLGRRRTFAYLLLASIVLGIISSFDPRLTEYYTSPEFQIWDLASILAFVLIIAAFMVDAYQEAVSRKKKA